MKKVAFLVLMLLAVAPAAIKAVAPDDPSHYRDPHTTVGAPVDGFLLLGLGAAGVAYYASKKRNTAK
jgi:hypothetical protein